MAVSLTLEDSGTIPFNSSKTLSDEGLLWRSGDSSIYVRAYATGNYNSTEGKYWLGRCYIEVKKSSPVVFSAKFEINSTTSDPNVEINYPQTKTFYAASTYETCASQGENAKKENGGSSGSERTSYVKLKISGTLTINWTGGHHEQSFTISANFKFGLPDPKITIQYHKYDGKLFTTEYTTYNTDYKINDLPPKYNGKGWAQGKYTVTFDSNGGRAVPSKEVSYTQNKKFASWSGYTPGAIENFTSDQSLIAQYVNDGDPSNPTWEGSQIPNCSHDKGSNKYKYKIEFYNEGGLYDTKYTSEGTQTITYTFKGWLNSSDDCLYGGSDGDNRMTITGDTTMTAQWDTKESDKVSQKVSALPTSPSKYGYTFTGWFSYGNQIKVGTLISEDIRADSDYKARVYTVKFNVDGGKYPDEGDFSTFPKTFFEPHLLPSQAPTKVGYNFGGWTDETLHATPVNAGEDMGDIVYKYIYDTTGKEPSSLTLRARWIPIVNEVSAFFWVDDSAQGPIHKIGVDGYKYTIEDLTSYNNTQCYYIRYAPDGPGESRGDAYVFLGWCREKPENFDSNDPTAIGYHGVYDLADYAPKSELPFLVKKSDITDPSDWDPRKSAAKPIYGIWAKTGKFVKLASGWKKANMVYVKVDGKWKPVHDFYIKVDGQWKHEI